MTQFRSPGATAAIASLVLAWAWTAMAAGQTETISSPPQEVTITVPAGERQVFRGFGASLKAGWVSAYLRMPEAHRRTLSDLLWTDAKFNTLRIWFVMSDYAPEPGARRLDRVMPEPMVAVIRDAQARGMKHLVVGPCGVPAYMREQDKRRLRDDQFEAHAAAIADFIAETRDRHGIVFEATGIQNEPNTSHDCNFTADAMVRSVKLLRAALDERGLQGVKIIAPETASADRVAYEIVDALRADPRAWKAVEGISTHSYNMAATERLATVALEENKEFWQTESSSPGPESPGDVLRAATAATTALSDLNHAVTHWIYFIGFAPYDPRDNGTRIIGFDPAGEENWYTLFHKYHFLRQLALTFDAGAVLRKPTSTLDKSMVWTYGRKPRVVAAAGRNPDGSWAIGISNYTAVTPPTTRPFVLDNAPRLPQTYTVTLRLEELGPDPVRFALTRVTADGVSSDAEPLAARNGTLTVTIAPLELITLRSLPADH